MKNSLSRVERINYLTKNKRYSAPIAFQLKSAARKQLSAGAYKTWDYLRDLAAFDVKSYAIKIAQETLAKELDCSLKTINRHISEIKIAGFLTIKHNVKQDNANEPSTYYINFPESVFALAELENNRVSSTNEENFSSNSNLRETNQPSINNTTSPADFNTQSQDNTVQSPPLKNDVHFNNKKINNNNIVVDFYLYEENSSNNIEQIHNELKLELEKCQKQKIITNQQLAQLTPLVPIENRLVALKNILANSKTLQVDSKKQELNNQFQILCNQEENLKHRLLFVEQELKNHTEKENLILNPYFINQITGERQFNSIDIENILNKLKSYGFKDKQLNKLVNEVVFESRFGSLIKSTKNKEVNSIKKCINIGCKLIREGQWSTPSGLLNLGKN